MIDWEKPLRTVKDKLPARLLGRLNRKSFPRIVAVTPGVGEERVETYCDDGKYCEDADSALDLENAPETVTLWVNIYRDSLGRVHSGESWPSEDLAKRHRQPLCLTTVSFEVEVP